MKLNKKTGALVGLAALAAVGGTWAFYNQQASLTNPFSTTKYGSTMVEHFNPEDGKEWKPGAEVDKKVAAKNTGDANILVRIKMTETWSRDNAAFAVVGSINDDAFNVDSLADIENTQIDPTDGNAPAYTVLTEDGDFSDKDKTVVFKNITASSAGADIANGCWLYGGDGYWYWTKRLTKGETTGNLLNSVTLAKNTDMGKYEEKYAYAIVDEGKEPADTDWKTAKSEEEMRAAAKDLPEGKEFIMQSENNQVDGLMGYSAAAYDLEVTTEFLQATKSALDEWGGADVVPAAIYDIFGDGEE